jgi:RNA polymerase sigma factor (sigma-70 family)
VKTRWESTGTPLEACRGTAFDANGATLAGLALVEPSLILQGVEAAPPDDGQLMCRYADGDVTAFDTLYERHRIPLWRFLRRLLADETVTADVFQESWARVVAAADRYRPTAPFAAWLYRIAHNCCVDHWRRSGRQAQREVAADDDWLAAMPDCSDPGPAALAMRQQSLESLSRALAQLPDAQRAAFLMYAEAGLSLAEIAAATGVGPETAKSRLRYATAKLRRALENEGRGTGP